MSVFDEIRSGETSGVEQRLAALEGERVRLEKAFGEEYERLHRELVLKYHPQRVRLANDIKALRMELEQKRGAVEQFRWRMSPSKPTDGDTTRRMKRAMRRERKAKGAKA